MLAIGAIIKLSNLYVYTQKWKSHKLILFFPLVYGSYS